MQRFQRRSRVTTNPIEISNRMAKYGALDVCSLVVVVGVWVSVLGFALFRHFSPSGAQTEWLQLVLYLIAVHVFRAAVLSYGKPFLPDLPELLDAQLWSAFRGGLREVGLWGRLVGATSQEELNERVDTYFRDLTQDMDEALRNQDTFSYVAFKHLYLRARALAEGLLGVSVPHLAGFEPDSMHEPEAPISASVQPM